MGIDVSTNQTQALNCSLQRFNAIMESALADLCQHFGVDNLVQARKLKQIPRSGEAAGWNFYFHGVGLRVWRPGKYADFDFIGSGVSGGFDPWRILNYLAENRVPDFSPDLDTLKKLFKALEQEGQIRRVEASNLFVLLEKQPKQM